MRSDLVNYKGIQKCPKMFDVSKSDFIPNIDAELRRDGPTFLLEWDDFSDGNVWGEGRSYRGRGGSAVGALRR